MKSSNITFVIPILRQVDNRVLSYNINKMREVSDNIIVVSNFEIKNKNPSIIYVLKKSPNKFLLINKALENVYSKYTWITDNNIINDYHKGYEFIQKKRWCIPYSDIKEVSNKDISSFLEGQIKSDNKCPIKFGRYSYIIDTNFYKDFILSHKKQMMTRGFDAFKLDIKSLDNTTSYILEDPVKSQIKSDIKSQIKSDVITNIKPSSPVKSKRILCNIAPKYKPDNIDNGEIDLTVFANNAIVHVTNIPPNLPRGKLKSRVDLAMSSIESNKNKTVLLLDCGTTIHHREGWEFQLLKRDSKTELGNNKDLPYLKDLLDEAYKRCDDDGYILYTNSDCGISKHLYKDLLRFDDDIIEYNRKDVWYNPTTLYELYKNKYKPFYIGIDGLAIKSSHYKSIRNEIPDVIIGDPHWDTVVSGTLKTLGNVRQESYELYHPRHKQVWAIDKLNPAGKHNKECLDTAIKYGYMEINHIEEIIDTAIVIVNYGNDPLRLNATETAFRETLKQELNFKIYFVECVYDGKSNYSNFIIKNKRVKHILIKGNDSNRDLWQKESLMNIGANAVKEKYILFVDNDIYSHDDRWWRKMRDKLEENEINIVHGYRISKDTKDPRLNFQSLGSEKILNYKTDLDINPGLCWGITKKFFDSMSGLNPFFIDGGGDSGFVCEYLNTDSVMYDSYVFKFKWFHKIYRNMSLKGKMTCVDVDIIHVNHGEYTFRNYNTIRYAIDLLEKDIQDFLDIDKNGLLSWKDPICPERKIMKRRPEMFDDKIAEQIVKNEYKYNKEL